MTLNNVLAIKQDRATAAFHEALKRYPEAHGALVFLWGASGLGEREPTPEQMEWARQRFEARAAPVDTHPKGGDGLSGSVHG